MLSRLRRYSFLGVALKQNHFLPKHAAFKQIQLRDGNGNPIVLTMPSRHKGSSSKLKVFVSNALMGGGAVFKSLAVSRPD